MNSATFGCIAEVDTFYAQSLPNGNIMSGKYPVREVTKEKVYIESDHEIEHIEKEKDWK